VCGLLVVLRACTYFLQSTAGATICFLALGSRWRLTDRARSCRSRTSAHRIGAVAPWTPISALASAGRALFFAAAPTFSVQTAPSVCAAPGVSRCVRLVQDPACAVHTHDWPTFAPHRCALRLPAAETVLATAHRRLWCHGYIARLSLLRPPNSDGDAQSPHCENLQLRDCGKDCPERWALVRSVRILWASSVPPQMRQALVIGLPSWTKRSRSVAVFPFLRRSP
jgi:hypothetical protein